MFVGTRIGLEEPEDVPSLRLDILRVDGVDIYGITLKRAPEESVGDY